MAVMREQELGRGLSRRAAELLGLLEGVGGSFCVCRSGIVMDEDKGWVIHIGGARLGESHWLSALKELERKGRVWLGATVLDLDGDRRYYEVVSD